jgi:tetratricopeptide (TPR) repeat protein
MIAKSTAALLSLALVASPAAAQGGAPKCNISNGGSAQLAAAYDALGRYNTASSDDVKKKHLSGAVRQLTGTPDKAGTPAARAWILGQTLVAWSMEPSQPTIGPASSFGFATGDGTVDILHVADSAFRIVEKEHPGCATEVENLRRMPHVVTTNAAVEQFNAGNGDSAAVLAKRALMIYPKGAVANQLVGNAALKNKNEAEAIEAFQKAAEFSVGDEQLIPVRENALLTLAYLTQNRAEAAEGAQQQELGQQAVGYFREYLKLKPDDASAQSGLARALSSSGDSTAVKSLYEGMLQNTAKYTDSQLIDAGIGAANAGRVRESIGLLEAGLQQNPYYRDALYALALQYFTAKEHQKTVEATNRLLAVDPNNPDYYQLLSGSYQGLLETATDKKEKKTYQDAFLKAIETTSKMPVQVSIRDFAQRGDERVLSGSVANRTDKPASYVMRVEFLDRAGNVVATKEATVAPAPKGAAEFSVSASGASIAAYRYLPLTN